MYSFGEIYKFIFRQMYSQKYSFGEIYKPNLYHEQQKITDDLN